MRILGTSVPCGERKERCRDGVACVVYGTDVPRILIAKLTEQFQVKRKM